MNEISKLIEIAKNEVGYLEKKSNSQLDSKTANAGANNYTKYARDLDNIKDFYNGKKQGYAWCCVFVDWCMVQAFGVNRAKELLCYPAKSIGAGCGGSVNYYKAKGRYYTSNPKKGDQIFFKSGSTLVHTGLVINVDSTYVYTIEGNTSNSSEVIANGGLVASKKYKLNNSAIHGYGRPNYKVEETFEIKYVSAKDGLNVRNGKGTKYAIVKALDYGTQVSVYKVEDGWAYIGDGWVSNNYLVKNKPNAYETKKVTAKGGLNIRNKASIFGKKIGVLSYGAKVTIYSTKGSWAKIDVTAEKWCSKNYLK